MQQGQNFHLTFTEELHVQRSNSVVSVIFEHNECIIISRLIY